MSLMQRRKGRAYEQRIANVLRAAFPSCTVRRSSQADRAVQSDVYITGHPLLERLWLECNDARAPNPMVKLLQAERDAAGWNDRHRMPVVVWHKLGERTIRVTVRLWVLDTIRGLNSGHNEVVTMSLDEFLAVLMWKIDQDSKCTCTYEVGSGGPVCTCGRRAA